MAILKHIANKNADYEEAQRYLMFQYDESTNKPILNENGELIPRKEYFMDGINCAPFTFDMKCRELNTLYHKNKSYDKIKSHHYIISFVPKDATENGLTGERAQQLGIEYAKKNFPGHQALVCTHMDGHNESGNIHVHIVINSLRKYDVERQDFMERTCDSHAGYKHHVSKDYLIHLKQSLMDMCRREHLHQVDLLTPAEKKITDREYHAKRRGQKKLNERNIQILADDLIPRKTEFQTQKEILRSAIEDTASRSRSQEDFQRLLLEKYNIKLKVSQGRFSYHHPERNKYITGRMLGTHYKEDYLLSLFEINAKEQESEKKQIIPKEYKAEIKSPIPSKAAPTLEDSFSDIKKQASSSRKDLKSIEDKLRGINEQIHYTGQYLANKSVYQQFCKSKHKGQFRKEHSAEITLYETARKFLKEHSADGKLPSMKLLKAEKERLLQKKKEARNKYHYYHDYQKELHTVCSNVDIILGQTHGKQTEKQKSTDIS